MTIDSDEEAAATCTLAERNFFQSDTTSQLCNGSLVRAANKLVSLQKELLEFDANVPEIVTFNVDGRLFSVRREVLRRDPQSVLFLLAAHARHEGRAGAIAIPPCHAAPLFPALLNLLRGYTRPVPAGWHGAAAAAAKYFGLEHSWASRYPVAATGPFRPLFTSTGVSSSSLSLCRGDKLFSDVVIATASEFYGQGEHYIKLGVARCESVAVGVMAEEIITTNTTLSTTSVFHSSSPSGMALYWNNGQVTYNFGKSGEEKTGFAFAASTVIKVELDSEENIVKWILSGDHCVSVLRLPPKVRFAFVVRLERSSEVQILRGD